MDIWNLIHLILASRYAWGRKSNVYICIGQQFGRQAWRHQTGIIPQQHSPWCLHSHPPPPLPCTKAPHPLPYYFGVFSTESYYWNIGGKLITWGIRTKISFTNDANVTFRFDSILPLDLIYIPKDWVRRKNFTFLILWSIYEVLSIYTYWKILLK